MLLLYKLLAANADRHVSPPKAVAGKVWSMVDSRSEPNVANCKNVFPANTIRESPGQRQGLQYKGADGSLIPNEGECYVTHREANGSQFQFTVQHAQVHCPTLSVSELVSRDCAVTFHKLGGHIAYPDGRKIRCVAKEGVFSVLITVVNQDFRRRGRQRSLSRASTRGL